MAITEERSSEDIADESTETFKMAFRLAYIPKQHGSHEPGAAHAARTATIAMMPHQRDAVRSLLAAQGFYPQRPL